MLRGVRHLVQDEPDDDWLTRPDVLRGLRAVGDAGLVYDLLTATVADLRPYAGVVLDAFGPGRLMVGSDWPVCLLAAGYHAVIATALELIDGLSAAERREVLSGTATRVYRL